MQQDFKAQPVFLAVKLGSLPNFSMIHQQLITRKLGLAAQIQQLEKALRDHPHRSAEFNLEVMQQKLTEIQSANLSLKKELAENNLKIKKLVRKTAGQETQLQTMKDDLKGLAKENKIYQEKESEITRLKTKVIGLTRKKQELEEQLSSLNLNLEGQNEELTKTLRKTLDSQVILGQLKTKRAERQKQETEAEYSLQQTAGQDSKEIQKKISTGMVLKSTTERQLEDLESTHAKNKEAILSQEQEIESLTAQLTTLSAQPPAVGFVKPDKRQTKLGKSISKQRAANEKLRKEIADVKAELKKTETAIATPQAPPESIASPLPLPSKSAKKKAKKKEKQKIKNESSSTETDNWDMINLRKPVIINNMTKFSSRLEALSLKLKKNRSLANDHVLKLAAKMAHREGDDFFDKAASAEARILKEGKYSDQPACDSLF